MTFTYSLSTPYTDLTRVRYEIRDTVEASALFTDEEITFVLSEEGSVNLAVISLIRAKIGELANEENFKADWLSVDNRNKLDQLRALLQSKQAEYGLNSGTAGVVYRYRPDTRQHEEPDFSAPDYDYPYDDDDCLYN